MSTCCCSSQIIVFTLPKFIVNMLHRCHIPSDSFINDMKYAYGCWQTPVSFHSIATVLFSFFFTFAVVNATSIPCVIQWISENECVLVNKHTATRKKGTHTGIQKTRKKNIVVSANGSVVCRIQRE